MPTAERILQLMLNHPGEPLTPQEIMEELAIPLGEKREVRSILREMTRGGRLVRFRRGTYAAPAGRDTVQGVLQVTRKGDGYVIERGYTKGDSTQGDIYIPRKGMAQALDGDSVEVILGSRAGDRREGRILRVVRHAHEKIVGQFLHTGDGGLVLPKNTKLRRIRVLRRYPRTQIPEGAWVVARITHWGDSDVDHMIGRIEEVLGTEGDACIDVLVLLRDMGVETEFPPEVLAEAEAIPKQIEESEIRRRRDLRQMSIFTIDPETAKDFDDALSIERLENGAVRLGVHIADVAHYVRPGTALDDEAYARSTSIYPVDRVVPMLPPALSNEMCSLRPLEDRLTVSVFAELSPRGEILSNEIVESVIHSKFRLTYEEVQAEFDGVPQGRQELSSIRKELLALRDLTRQLTQNRMKRGALDLELPETDIIVGPDGKTVDVRPHPRLESHRLVEECMLLANEVVAQFMQKKNLPGLYRIHEEPDSESLNKLRAILNPFGVRFPSRHVDKSDLQYALDQVHRIDGGTILMRFVLRAMKKARYDGKNVGHFGLASPCYCHFTSPIRRYPDTLVHRLIKESIQPGGGNQDLIESMRDRVEEQGIHTSEREMNADDIERQATTIKSLEFLLPHLGEVFEGRIAGVAQFGIFVQLNPWPIEGLVPVRELDDDFYEFDEITNTLHGRASGKVYRLTDKVKVQIQRIDPTAGQMDLALVQASPRRPAKSNTQAPRFKRTKAKKRGKKSR